MLDAAEVHLVSRDEHLQEMGIQSPSRVSPEPAKARELRVPLQMDPPVGSLIVFRCEHPEKVIPDYFVISVSFEEAARTPLRGHTISLSGRCLVIGQEN